MAKRVSSKTHTKKQLDNYANQQNPNNKAYRANRKNTNSSSGNRKSNYRVGDCVPNEWFYYGNPFDIE